MARFTVDTHLFRELGALLVGRDSTALLELIKNAYDADAEEVVVYGENLEDVKRGFIRITDDGIGMTTELFEDGFLRIASRVKEQGDRKSAKFKRRYTGAKGIGRLAAHKLAKRLSVVSIPNPAYRDGASEGVEAAIDWDEVERYQTLEELGREDQGQAVSLISKPVPKKTRSGTTITLSSLRRRWTERERARFIDEIQNFTPPSVLTQLPAKVVDQPLLFDTPLILDPASQKSTFLTKLEGSFFPSEDYWITLAQNADWLIEVDASALEKTVRYNVLPTRHFVQAFAGDSKPSGTTIKTDHPNPSSKISLQARILVKEGSSGSRQMKTWAGSSYGVRVFLEGFRVLPYGEKSNDWLSLDLDYARRSRATSSWLDQLDLPGERDEDDFLTVLPNRSYFGAVFLTQSNAPSLQMLVNREGFIPDANYDAMVEIVKNGIDLAIRTRAAANLPLREKRRQARTASRIQVERERTTSQREMKTTPIRDVVASAQSLVSEARRLVVGGNISDAAKRIETAESTFSEINDRLIEESSMLRVLASVGTQMAAFIHEINALLGMSATVETSLEKIQEDVALPKKLRADLNAVLRKIGDLRRALERQASYLMDVVTPDSRRRRRHMSFAERFDSGRRLVEHVADQRSIFIANGIPPSLKSPPMYPAELTTVFSNLLTNAVKAAGPGGRIRASARSESSGGIEITIENSGAKVTPSDGEHWFEPFASTTTSVDPVLGQGMGLGLPITRTILEQYGAQISFVEPSSGFSTAVRLHFPPE